MRAPEATGAVLSSRGAAARFPACLHALLAPHAPAPPFHFDVYLHRAACWNLRLNPRAAPHPSQRAHWRCLVGHADDVVVGAPAAALQLGGSGPLWEAGFVAPLVPVIPETDGPVTRITTSSREVVRGNTSIPRIVFLHWRIFWNPW